MTVLKLKKVSFMHINYENYYFGLQWSSVLHDHSVVIRTFILQTFVSCLILFRTKNDYMFSHHLRMEYFILFL